ncbi:NAD-dependent epimerase/dehydratase family protein [Azospirillum sp.]|uniref:NAD-dependent epimerase/dehydratase family protein n=1 Tax=Azospirillum sp. TaxID=34012 RepID=UPI002D508A0C|nr:NAD-dependent epimerase/dehydratase family protein [Azospirillum sp.]HYD67803.1 NAD-dependent epimerase/dehydratase family protein [Azospirillum sp.]
MAAPEARPEILVVGRNSVLAGAFAACAARPPCRFVSHGELDRPGVFDGIRTVVNFALHPDTRRTPYDPAKDADLAVGRAAADRALGFVLLSTRKVYDPAALADLEAGGAAEDAPLGPTDHYGANKLRTEEALRALLGERLTVLRIANIVGFDRVPGRAMFMNRMLDTLAAQGCIRFDVSPFVRRDFLPDDDFARALAAVLERGLTGTFNVGSGYAVEVGRLALWVMEGYGAGELRITDPRHHDEFVLNVDRLQTAIGPLSPAGRLEELCRAVGRRLRSAE